MLSTLHESKIKKDLENERYDTMITQYRKDIREYGNKTHIEYINNYFNPDKIIDKIFSTLDTNPGSNNIKCDIINNKINLEIDLFDLIKQKYINNESKFNLCVKYCDGSFYNDMFNENVMDKINKILEYCKTNKIECNNKFLFGKSYGFSNCANSENYKRDKHWCYISCENCRLSIFKNKQATRIYKNNESIYNNIKLNTTVKLARFYAVSSHYYYNWFICITIDCDITNLYKINNQHDEIIKILPIIQMKYDKIEKSPNKPDNINHYLQKMTQINDTIPLIKDNKLYIIFLLTVKI